MFENITQSYDKTDATLEILILLIVAFILGYLLRYFIGGKYRNRVEELEEQLDQLESRGQAPESQVGKDFEAERKKLNREIQSLRSSNEGLEAQIVTLKSTNDHLQSEVVALKEAAKKQASTQVLPAMSVPDPEDNLKQIEGIGPKIEQLLKNDGIKTFEALSKAKTERLKEILKNGGDRFRMHDPGTWPRQAKMAAKGEWIKLVRWQDEMDGGKE